MSRTCDVKGCQEAPTHRAEMVIYAAVDRVHEPAIGTMGIRVCAEHADEAHAKELLTDEGKRQISAGFTRIGRAAPDWNRSFVRWVKEADSRE